MELIDPKELADWLTSPTGFPTNCEDCMSSDCLACIVGECIENFHTVDAIQVIHCAGCKFCHENSESPTGYTCGRWGTIFEDNPCDPNGYCYKAERRDCCG